MKKDQGDYLLCSESDTQTKVKILKYVKVITSQDTKEVLSTKSN